MTAPIIEGAGPISIEGDDRGVLVVHGYTSDPRSMRPVADALSRAGFTVELPLLPGHGTAVEDLIPTGFPDWLAVADAAYVGLTARCRSVAVVGLSMGGAITAWLASEHPDVAGIACLNAIVTPPEGMRAALDELLAGGMEVIPGIGSDIAKPGVTESAYADTPLRPLLSLFEAADEFESRLGRITCPVLIVNSPQDHVVEPVNSDVLAASVAGPVERITAADSYHVVTLDHDAPAVIEAVVSFCTKVTA